MTVFWRDRILTSIFWHNDVPLGKIESGSAANDVEWFRRRKVLPPKKNFFRADIFKNENAFAGDRAVAQGRGIFCLLQSYTFPRTSFKEPSMNNYQLIICFCATVSAVSLAGIWVSSWGGEVPGVNYQCKRMFSTEEAFSDSDSFFCTAKN